MVLDYLVEGTPLYVSVCGKLLCLEGGGWLRQSAETGKVVLIG
jgi:hypothetical protein